MNRYQLTIPAQEFSEPIRPGFRKLERIEELNFDLFVQPLIHDARGSLTGMITGFAQGYSGVLSESVESLAVTGNFATTRDDRFMLTHGLFPTTAFQTVSHPGYATVIELSPIDILHDTESKDTYALPELHTPRGYTGYIGFSHVPLKLLYELSGYSYQRGTSVHSLTTRTPELRSLIEWRTLKQGTNFKPYNAVDDPLPDKR